MNRQKRTIFSILLTSLILTAWGQSNKLMQFRFADRELDPFTAYVTHQFHQGIYKAVKSGELQLYADLEGSQTLSKDDAVKVLSEPQNLQVINPLTPDDPFNLVDTVMELPIDTGNWSKLYTTGELLIMEFHSRRTAVMKWNAIKHDYTNLLKHVVPKERRKAFGVEQVRQSINSTFHAYKEVLFQINLENKGQASVTGKLEKKLSSQEQSDFLKRMDKLKVPFNDEGIPYGQDTVVKHPVDVKHCTQLVFNATYSLGATSEFTSYSFGLGIDFLWEFTPGEPAMMNRVSGWLPYHLIPDNLAPEHFAVHDAIYQYSMIKSLGLLEKK